MNSSIKLVLGNDEEFDKAVHGTADKKPLPDAGDLSVITKDNGTERGNPIACLTFSVQLPDGSMAQVQTVVTVGTLQMMAAGLRGRYPNIG